MADILFRAVVPGPPTNKKNRGQIFYPWIPKQRLRLSGVPVRGLADFLRYLAGSPNPKLILSAARYCNSVILPSADYRKWEKVAVAAFQGASGGITIEASRDSLLGLSARFYLAPRQRPDLPGLVEAVCDSLETAGVVNNDYFVNSLDVRRIWPPSGSTKAIKLARESWQPRTVVSLWKIEEKIP